MESTLTMPFIIGNLILGFILSCLPIIIFRYMIIKRSFTITQSFLVMIAFTLIKAVIYIILIMLAGDRVPELKGNMIPPLWYIIDLWILTKKSNKNATLVDNMAKDIPIGINNSHGESEMAIEKRDEVEGWIKSYQEELLDDELRKHNDLFNDIFELSVKVLWSLAPKDLLSTHGMNADAIALNVIQNTAMTSAIDANTKDYYNGGFLRFDVSCKIYKKINDIKLKKSYISKVQYEQNEGVLSNIQLQKMT